MITITDFSDLKSPYWKVVDSTGRLEKSNFPYNPDCIIGYDCVRMLKQIVDVYSVMSECQNKAWQVMGSVFILT